MLTVANLLSFKNLFFFFRFSSSIRLAIGSLVMDSQQCSVGMIAESEYHENVLKTH